MVRNSSKFSLLAGYPARYVPWRYDCAVNSSLQVTEACKYPGLASEVFLILTKLAGIDFDIWFTNASYISTMQQLANGSIDTAVLFTQPSMEMLRQGVHMSYPLQPLGTDWRAISVDSVRQDWFQTALNFVSVYELTVWLGFVFVYVLAKVNRLVFRRLFGDKEGSHWNTEGGCVLLVSFFTLLFSNLYKSGLLSRLLLTHERHLFKDFDQFIGLLEDGDVQLITLNFSYLYSERADARRLWRAMDENPPIILDSFFQFDNYKQPLRNGDVVFITDALFAEQLSTKWCNTRSTRFPGLGRESGHLLFSRNVPKWVAHQISFGVIEVFNGLWHIKHRYERLLETERVFLHCPKAETAINRKHGNVEIVSLIGIFALLWCGTVLAAGCLLLEICYRFVKKRK